MVVGRHLIPFEKQVGNDKRREKKRGDPLRLQDFGGRVDAVCWRILSMYTPPATRLFSSCDFKS